MKKLEGGVAAPTGFRASGVSAGIKPGSKKKDCAIVASTVPAVVTGVFTTNLFKAPPVRWCEEVCKRGTARGVFLNSGNANACTGEQGYRDVQATAEMVGRGLGAKSEQIAVLSTGVIGVPLPMDRVEQGVWNCLKTLSPHGGRDAAEAILTTDTVTKEVAVEFELTGGSVRIGAMAKGAGMIAPNLATMLCVITTDAAIEAEGLAELLKRCAALSFNQMCIDNDTSTNDSVLVLANGQSGVPQLVTGSPDYLRFGAGLAEVCKKMTRSLVRDGEGATKLVEITVAGAPTDEDAKTIARAVATSQLCKTAFFGQDPNWGRIACAAGYAGVPLDPERVSLWIDDVQVMVNGMAAPFDEADAKACMRKPRFRVHLDVGDGPGSAVFWTSDLSTRYVEINASYRS